MDNKNLIKEMLACIDPARLTYQEWIDVGMAIKAEGLSCKIWDDWSKADARYKSGECWRKWKSFSGTGITGATITHLAKEGGWTSRMKSSSRNGYEAIEFDDEVAGAEWIETVDPAKPLSSDPTQQALDFIRTNFESGDLINIVTQALYKEDKNKWIPGNKGFTYPYDYIVKTLEKDGLDFFIGDRNKESGVWIRSNAMDGKGSKNKNVTSFRYVLVESDTMSIEKQIDTYKLLNLPISTLTTSGRKSVHALVKVDAKNYEEYKERVKTIFNACRESGMEIDSQNKNPSRLTRMPGVERGKQFQSLIGINIGAKNYKEWLDNLEIDDLPDYESLDEFLDDDIELPPETIRGILRKGEKLVLTGPSKAGKSFALIQLGIACAVGGWWMGKIKCAPQRVIYINFELTALNSKIRTRDVWNALKCSSEGAKNFKIWNLRGKIVTAKSLVETIIRRSKSMANPPELYIIDPIYKINVGDENSAKDMNELLREFDRLCSETGANLAYAHHHAKGSQFGKRALDRGSGSGVIGRDADAAVDLDFLFVPDKLKKEKAEYYHDQSWTKATGLRLEMTLRNFENRKPFNVWFKYPIHIFDGSEDFQTLKGDSEKNNFDKAEDGKQKKKDEASDQIRAVLNRLLDESGKVRIGEIITHTGFSRNTIKRFVEENNDFRKDKEGYITWCPKPDFDTDT